MTVEHRQNVVKRATAFYQQTEPGHDKLAQLPDLALLEVTNDPNSPTAVEDLERIFTNTGSVNLMLSMTSAQVRAHLDNMGGRNIFLRVECQDYADAADVITFIRDRLKSLSS